MHAMVINFYILDYLFIFNHKNVVSHWPSLWSSDFIHIDAQEKQCLGWGAVAGKYADI